MPPNPRATQPLIFGAAVGYLWPQIRPFAHSLRASGCAAKTVLLVSRMDRETRHELQAHAITALPVHGIVTRLPPTLARKRYNRYWLGWLHRVLPRAIGASTNAGSLRNAILARAAAWFHQPASSRYFHYLRYLRHRVARHDWVLTTDVRDVIFQSDPFAPAWRPAGGVVFLDQSAAFGSDAGNDRWVTNTYGEAGLAPLLGRRVSCSGNTLAPAPLMLQYLAAMTRELAFQTDRISGHEGVDQGVHNWLFHTGRLAGFTGLENGAGPVLTMHNLPAERIPVDSTGRLLDRAGRVIPLLHQYDRNPAQAAQLLGRLS